MVWYRMEAEERDDDGDENEEGYGSDGDEDEDEGRRAINYTVKYPVIYYTIACFYALWPVWCVFDGSNEYFSVITD